MKIRLMKDAPWDTVKLPSGLILNKTDYVEQENHNILSIEKWIQKEVTETFELINGKLNYSSMTKADLLLYCDQNNIDVGGLNKDQIVRKLIEIDEKEKEKANELIISSE